MDIPQVSKEDFYQSLFRDCEETLAKLEKTRDKDKELRYAMLGLELPDHEKRMRAIEVRGIAGFHLSKQSRNPALAEAKALEDLMVAKAARPLVPEAASILATLESTQQANQQVATTCTQHVAGNVQNDAIKATGTTDDKGLSAPFDEQSTASNEVDDNACLASSRNPIVPMSSSEWKSQNAFPQTGEYSNAVGDTTPSQLKVSLDLIEQPGVANIVGNVTDEEIDAAEPSIEISRRAQFTIVSVTPADAFEVYAGDGEIRFSRGERFWQVPIDGVATIVKRRRDRLEVVTAPHRHARARFSQHCEQASF